MLTYGLDGLEVQHPDQDEVRTASAERIADQLDLLKCGGSDYHGESISDIRLGTGRGRLCVPLAFLTALEARAERIRRDSDPPAGIRTHESEGG